MSWSHFVAFRFLRPRQRGLLFSVMVVLAMSGIAFGMAALLVSSSVITGFQKVYEQAIVGFNAHLVVLSDEKDLDQNEKLKDPDIVSSSPYLVSSGLALGGDEPLPVEIKGVDAQTFQEVYPLNYQAQGDAKRPVVDFLKAKASVVLGATLYRKLKLDPHRPMLRLLIAKQGASQQKLESYVQEFEVVGTFESGIHEFDSQFILTSLTVMTETFAPQALAEGVEVYLQDRYAAPQVAKRLEDKLGPDFQVISWQELNEPLFRALKLEKVFFSLVMFLIFLIAAFNMVGLLVMLLSYKQKEMAVFKVLGASLTRITQAFSLYGLYLGLLGVVMGSLLSWGLLWSLAHYQWIPLEASIYFIDHVPIAWPVNEWLVLVAVAILVCFLVSKLTSHLYLSKTQLNHVFR